jgi:uncharacterized glyoxalase superfamily protein PhnB
MSKQPLIEQLEQAISRMMADPTVREESIDSAIVELLHVARDLRELPRPDFKASLKAELERTTIMKAAAVQFRAGFRTITPYLLPPGPEFVDFLKNVFDAEETERTDLGPGRFHAEVKIGDSMLMMGIGSGRHVPGSFIVYVDNPDETYRRALEAGAKSVTRVTENYGDRFGVVEDPAGNGWCIAKFIGPSVVAQEHLNTITSTFTPIGSVRFVDFLKQAFNAEEIVRYDSGEQGHVGLPPNVVVHAKIRIGNSVVAVGEAHRPEEARPVMTYMYVPDCDAVYAQALRAGAKSISPVANQSYGDRHGGVEDPWGNQWYIATPL